MKFEEFTLERNQSLFENIVDYNLSESGVHPLKINKIFNRNEINQMLELELTYGYTNGSPKLREEISKMYHKEIESENVLVTSGTAEANFIAFMINLEKNDEVVYMTPNYLQLKHLSKSFGIKLKELPLNRELGWQWDIDDLKKVVTEKTKMIIVCNPNNPTGSIMSNDVMKEVVKIAEINDCWILADEVYRGSELSGIESRSFAGLTEKVIVNGGLSKAYSLPGLRLGWSVGPKKYVENAWSFHDYTTISVSYLSDWVASKVLEPLRRETILKRTKYHLEKNFELVLKWSQEVSKLKIDTPQATAMIYAKINASIPSDNFVRDLRDKFGVLLTVGSWHGLEGYVRIGYGGDYDYVRKALNRVSTFLEKI